MGLPNDDSVRFDILIEAKAALKSLQELLRETEDNRQKIIMFTQTVVTQSKLWGISWQQALNVYKQLNAELSKSKKPNLFGNTGGQDLLGMSEKYLQTLESTGRLQENVGKSAKKMGDEVEGASKRAVRGIDLIRIAAGALVAMFIFNVIAAIQNTFRQAIQLATEFEDTLYRLRNVEQSLSLSGIEISMKGLKQGIADIQKLLPIFSKEDVSQLVGTLAISTKQLGLNEQQILDLAKAIGILNIRSEKQEELSVTAQHVLSSLLTGNAKGITALGIAFTDNVMKAKAMELGFLSAGDALSTLTENEKGITKLQIVLDSTGGELANVGDYLESNSAKLQQNKAAWNDLLTTLGQLFLPFIPIASGFFKIIEDGFNMVKVITIEVITVISALGVTLTMLMTGQISSFGQMFEVLGNSMNTFREAMVNKLFKGMPDDAPDWFKERWGSLIKEEAETATSGINEFAESVEDFDASGFDSEIKKILEDLAQAREDLDTKLSQKQDDLDTEYLRKALDAERDYQRKVEDINRDAEREMSDVKTKHRQEDKNAEEKYQLALWELRMRYLMDLEDALHARDARQVIRLQKQYALDKETLEKKHNLEEEQRNWEQRRELEDIELKRQQRLEDAKIEYQQKLADQQIAKQRELDDLNTWYAREQADLELAVQRKLQTLIDGWIEEKKITDSNAAEVYGILRKYFGPGGMTDGLYQYMMNSLLQVSANAAMVAGQMALLGSIGGGVDGGGHTTTDTESGGSTGGEVKIKKGRMENPHLAQRSAGMFGSIPDSIPVNQIGRNNQGMSSSNSGRTGMEGAITVEVSLSPDLEARVVQNSMDGVANVISRVTNSK